MKSPFRFEITLTESERCRRRVIYSVTAVLLMILFTVGFITVYVNSYNIIHSEPMEVFGFYRTSDGIGFVLFNKFFSLF